VGRLSLEKGQIDLIHAFAQLRAAHPDLAVKLVLVGEGPEQGRPRKCGGALNVLDRVRFRGSGAPDVGPFFKMADVMALPSHGEGSPNVLLEAITAGVPTVSTDSGRHSPKWSKTAKARF
jgi:glycosyltransferase involved in cell wall biosynthesis